MCKAICSAETRQQEKPTRPWEEEEVLAVTEKKKKNFQDAIFVTFVSSTQWLLQHRSLFFFSCFLFDNVLKLIY